jgi:recombination protein RecA
MTNLETFLAGLDPKTAKRIKTAQETEIERLELASYSLTEALGGGVAKGRISLFYGNQSAGKSLLFQESIGKIWQPQGQVCAYVDAEGAYDKDWARRLGVNNDELILIQSKSSGKIEKELVPLLQNNIDVVVIDSISDIMPETFINKDGSLNDQVDRKQIGAHAKAITALINGLLYVNENTAIVLLSQTTTKIANTYIQFIPHGGQKTLFAASQIVKLTSSNTDANQIKGEIHVGEKVFEKPIGRHVEGFVEKNKLGKAHETAEYDMYYGGKNVGIDLVGEVVDEAIKFDVIDKRGGWFYFGEDQWQGRPAVVKHFQNNPEDVELAKKRIAVAKTGELPLDE